MDITATPVRASRIAERNLAPQAFGTVFCDHMLAADYRDGEWADVRIEPYAPLGLAPSISALQYGISVFEGHKAFRTRTGEIALFRPYENSNRLRRSCDRLVLPEVPEEIYIEGLKQLIRTDSDWVPGPDEGSLYIRPCVFATDTALREHRFVEEAGVMNVFFVIDDTVVTPALSGTIMPGVTRDSVITLLKAMGVRVEERLVALDEVVAAHAAGRLRECFGTGTAATVSHVAELGYDGQILTLPPVADREIGPAVLARITALRTGREPDPHRWLIPV